MCIESFIKGLTKDAKEQLIVGILLLIPVYPGAIKLMDYTDHKLQEIHHHHMQEMENLHA